jgi:polyphosphate kinase
MYEDLGLFSADQVLGEDLNKLFNQLSGFAPQSEFKRLLVSPRGIRSKLLEKIAREEEHARVGKPASIRIKLNSILDEEFVEAFYRAAQAGVKIELIVRGICAVRAQVTKLSENITVRSILGRFLEHSRVFNFYNDGNQEYFIGSADLMDRNLNRRVESLVQIEQENHKKFLDDLLSFYLADDVSRWKMNADGRWQRISKLPSGELLKDVQQETIEKYRTR